MATAAYALSKLELGEALSKGWLVLKENWQSLGKLILAYFVAGIVPSFIIGALFEEGSALAMLGSLVMQVWGTFLSIGMTKGVLAVIRGGTVEIPAVFQNQDVFVNYFIMMIRYMLVIIGGLILFVIPGIYFAFRYMFVPFLVVDGKATGAEAFRKSKEMTEGRLVFFLVFAVVSYILVLLGLVALIVGAFVVSAVVGLAYALIYDYLISGKSAK